jgi:DNA-binding CsgD family transcriptional regulator
LRAINKNGQISDIHRVPITIQTPWYYSTTADIIYALIILGVILALLLIPRKKYKKNTAVLVTKQKETEEEMEKIKKQKLENEIQFKNKELASTTMHLLQKNQTISNVRTQIDSLRKKVQDGKFKKELNSIISYLRSDLRLEEDWDRFSIHFDQVHHDFIRRLKEKYPSLTPRDHQLCAYLKMNLTTKEIAPLLNISVRGVEIGRYRLRKKLSLDKSVNLNDFMNQF